MTRVLTAKGEQKDALADFIPFIPRTRLSKSANQTIAAASGPTIVTWDTEEYDTDTLHDLGINPGRITIKTAGVYFVKGSVAMSGNMAANDELTIYKNGATILDESIYVANQQTQKVAAIVELAVGDYLEMRQTNTGAAGRDVASAGGYSRFEAIYVGPGFNAVRAKPVIQYVTPTQFAALAPIDGDEVYLTVDATNGVVWHLRYNAGSASAYKWEYLGGSDMRAEVNGGESTSSGTFVDLATVMSLVVPRSGDYEVHWGARRGDGPTGNSGLAHSLAWGANAAAFAPYCLIYVNGSGAGASPIAGQKVITATASDVLKVKYQANAGVSAPAEQRYLSMRPVRIS